ncbi:uncharacterized protein LOC126842403 isoform X8 [Adelges cooleyi]|uniref:uncharacterized protein LOC126842403 isoform X8 n=1 Tax=Adelges cooleyi TaxID=133065 RepID=UPI0021800DEF|nr:uncharacterized protein LOC126842403 isoform X8 [Adelges cooleyi]
MKLLCILITLAFVNVSPIMTSHYANSVYITNKYIKEAFDKGDPFIVNLPEKIAIDDQLAVQEAIYQATKITVPKLSENENFENDSLNTFGEQRRLITGKVTKNALIAAIDKGRPRRFTNLNEICRLMGALRSIKFPDQHIRNINVDESANFCILTSQNDSHIYQRDVVDVWAVIPMGGGTYFEDIMYHIQNWFL